MMNNTLITAAVCLLAGGGIGYFVANGSDSDASTTVESVTRVSSRDRSSSSAVGEGRAPRSYEEIAALPGQTARVQKLIEFYADLSPSEFQGEADKLGDLPMSERILASYLLFASWAEVAPYDALSHANTKMGFTGNFVKPTILQSWAATDASGAAGYYEANRGEFAMMGMMGRGRGGRGGGQNGAGVISGEWAKQDPEGSLAWAQTLEGKEQEQATTGALSQMAKSDPEAAAAKLAVLGEDGGDQAYRAVAMEWAKEDWDATEAWVNSLSGDKKDKAMGDAISSLASIDADKAAAKALTLPEGDVRSQAFEDVAGAMAGDNASDAMAWVMKNGSEDAQKESVGDVMGPWVSQDKNGALEWISDQPEGGVRDEAVQSFVFNDHNQVDGSTMAMAESISDEGSRQRAVGIAAFRWVSNDQEAGMKYIETSQHIDQQSRQRILQRAGVDQK